MICKCDTSSFFFFNFFAVTSHHFVQPLVLSVSDFGWLCPWVSWAMVDQSLPALCSRLCAMILRVNSEFPGLGLVPILHLGMVMLLLEWLPELPEAVRTQHLDLICCVLCIVYSSYIIYWLLHRQDKRMDELNLFIDYHTKYIVSIIWARHVLTLHLSHTNCCKLGNTTLYWQLQNIM